MTTLSTASTQWATRPADERFTSLDDMQNHFDRLRDTSRAVVVSSRRLEARPASDNPNHGIEIFGPNGHGYAPTNWSFGQLAQLAEAPAGYLRSLPAPIAADCINYGLQFKRSIEDVGVLLQRPVETGYTSALNPVYEGEVTPVTAGAPILAAATGPRYGRIWNADVVRALRGRFGDGVTGDFRVPGEFGQAVTVDNRNTTLYAGDRDMFVFLADEEHRIEIPNRRNGEPGTLARGFFAWNSEVGASTFGVATFLFDYVCKNRTVWGPADYKQITVRHTAGAPDRFVEEVAPALVSYANSSTASVVEGIEAARAARIDDVDEFLAKRFGKRTVEGLKAVHLAEEGRPIESLWDAANAVTAKAKAITWQDERVAMERQAGELLALASA